MHVFVTCKNKYDSIKNEGPRVVTKFSHYKSIGIFPDAQGQLTPQSLGLIWPNFELVRDVMDVLFTCKKIRS